MKARAWLTSVDARARAASMDVFRVQIRRDPGRIVRDPRGADTWESKGKRGKEGEKRERREGREGGRGERCDWCLTLYGDYSVISTGIGNDFNLAVRFATEI